MTNTADFSAGLNAYQRGDYATALRIMRELADQGDADAQFSVGIMYALGLGVKQDYAAAVRWYRKAAEQGHSSAQNNLGIKYHKGQGVTQDYVQAHMWYNLAAAQGRKFARGDRDNLAELMTPSQIAEAQKLAREWKPTGE